MAGTFSTIFVTELKLKLAKLNHTAEIYAKYHWTNKLLNNNFVLGRDILHVPGLILKCEN